MVWRRKREKRQVSSINVHTYNCIGCGACVSRCRQHVLKLVGNGVCQYAEAVNPKACVGCGRCIKACPAAAVELLLA